LHTLVQDHKVQPEAKSLVLARSGSLLLHEAIQAMTVAIVGSRSFDNYSRMRHTLFFLFEGNIDEIVSGGAQGADKLAEQYADEYDIPIRIFAPDWESFGKSAGYIRNKIIVEHADHVVAYWDGKSKGTQHTIEIAQKERLPVTIFEFTPE
jgi:hypothetical protein